MKRDLFSLPLDLGNELIIDNFAGGGGTSTGLEAAFGRPVDIAINHDPEALAMHAMNHPYTRHLCESVWDVDPILVTNNQPVALITPTLVQTGYGERDGQAPRALDIERPLGTVVSGGKHALVSAFLNEHANASTQRVIAVDEPMRTICGEVKGGHFGLVSATLVDVAHGEVSPSGVKRWHYSGVVGSELADPIGTVTSTDHHSLVHAHLTKFRTGSIGSDAEVRAFLVKYYSTDQDPRLEEPLHTVTTKDRFGLVTIQGVDYEIVDIGLRMLAPHELYLAQGFPADYVIEEILDPALLFAGGEQVAADPLQIPRVPLTKSAQVRMCGNSVCPPVSEALIRANFAHEQSWAAAA